ncbi:MAG: hypothetical protein P4L76_05275 [Beijerinckiaceae bacterium]|nr:hypothetical protein [Beijerinckiaceae bacterium]
MTTIIEALDDDRLLGAAIKDPSTFASWRVALKALFALPMTDEELALFRTCTGRCEAPTAAFAVLWLVCGRRGGKSFMMALVAVFMAVFKDWRPYLSPGERAVVLIVAADREQAKVIRRYVGGIMDTPMFRPRVEGETADGVELTGSVVIEVATCSYRTVRGRSVCVALLDEVAFWRSESTANPDREVWRAIRGSMGQFGSESVAIIGSSPYAKRGLLYDGFKRFFGGTDAKNLVWQAPTKTMNPLIPADFLAEEFEADPASFDAEYNANFRGDIESFVSLDVVTAATIKGRFELPRDHSKTYVGFVDPAGGSGQDSMTLAIAHTEEMPGRADMVAVLDLVREIRPPFSPDAATEELATTLKVYGLTSVTGDRYAAEWPRERFRAHGITYHCSEHDRSKLYAELLPALNSGLVELLDIQKLAAQLCALERRPSRGGRDGIDHPRGAHDDLINAAAGALVLVGGKTSTRKMWELLAED